MKKLNRRKLRNLLNEEFARLFEKNDAATKRKIEKKEKQIEKLELELKDLKAELNKLKGAKAQDMR
jgi:hypothetical protein